MRTADPHPVARRVLSLPLAGIAAATKLTLAPFLATFNPTDAVEARAGLAPDADGDDDPG